MDIKELVTTLNGTQYKNDPNDKKKIELIRKHLKTEYVSYNAKIDICSNILKASRYHNVNDKQVYSPNGPLEYELKIISIIQVYYDFELKDGLERIEDFDLLEKYNISSLLIEGIKNEYIKLNAIYNMMAEDISYKESLIPYIDSRISSLGVVNTQWLNVFSEYLEKTKAQEE